ncbi:glycosyltransferase [Dehalogenimonas sp. THU2]|uniref:glycosyltransferase n=1 Tax=Dehalogenimonas sp. THU2 TaxID=3151121 RepID=UPI0032187CCC
MKTNKPRTVLHLADASSPQTLALLNELAESGWKVHLLSHQSPAAGVALNAGIKVHRLVVSPAYPLTYLAFINAAPMILSIKPDIIHAHYVTQFGIMAAVHRRFLRFKPMVLTACGRDVLTDTQSGMTRWSAEHAIKMFEAVTAASDEVIAALRDLEAPMHRVERIDWSAGTPESIKTAANQLDTLYSKLIGILPLSQKPVLSDVEGGDQGGFSPGS